MHAGARGGAQSILVAVGIITSNAANRRLLRDESRSTWLQQAQIPPHVAVHFVISGCASDQAIHAEQAEAGDILCVNATTHRARGPVQKQWLWLATALELYPRLHAVAIAEDDVYLRLPQLAVYLLSTTVLPYPFGVLGYFAWSAWTPHGCPVSWWFLGSTSSEKRFRFHCGNPEVGPLRCYGPFSFPAGGLMAFSAPLAQEMVDSEAFSEALDPFLPACEASLGATDHLRLIGAGGVQRGFEGIVGDDIWMGYSMWRHLSHVPIVFHHLPPPLVSNKRGIFSNATLAYHDLVKAALFAPDRESGMHHVARAVDSRCVTCMEPQLMHDRIPSPSTWPQQWQLRLLKPKAAPRRGGLTSPEEATCLHVHGGAFPECDRREIFFTMRVESDMKVLLRRSQEFNRRGDNLTIHVDVHRSTGKRLIAAGYRARLVTRRAGPRDQPVARDGTRRLPRN